MARTMGRLMTRITDDENLRAAWRHVRRDSGGGAGADGVTLTRFEDGLDESLADLAARLRDERYCPPALRHVGIPGAPGIPTVADRVAQRAFVNVLEPLLDRAFLPCSYGYRPGRGVADATQAVLEHRAAGYAWVVDAGIADLFPSMDHALLLAALRRHLPRVPSGDAAAVVRCVGRWLDAGLDAGAPADADDDAADAPTLLGRAAESVWTAARTLLVQQEAPAGPMPDAREGDPDDAGAAPDGLRRHALRQFSHEAARLAWEYRGVLLPVVAAAARPVLVGAGVAAGALGAAALGERLLRRRHRRRRRASADGGAAQKAAAGAPLSPLLANVCLHEFDVRMTEAGWRLVRYADDLVICCQSEADARRALADAADALAALRLRLNPRKTRIVPDGDLLAFLGHTLDDREASPIRPPAPPDDRRAAHSAALRHAARRGATVAAAAGVRAGNGAARTVRRAAAAARSTGSAFAADLGERWHEMRRTDAAGGE